jgi:hypothetical protein
MNESRAPLHLWIVGILALLWNSFGCYDYLMTQTQNEQYLAMFTPEQRTYFSSFPAWTVAAWAIGVWGALAGSILLLIRKRLAVTAFGLSLLGLAISTFWQFFISATPMRKVMGQTETIITVFVWVVAIALLLYARAQSARGVLR